MEILKTGVRCLGWAALIAFALSAAPGKSLFFLVGVFLFLAFYPILRKHTQRLKGRFEAEFAVATGVSIATMFLLGAVLPENLDVNEFVGLIILGLGTRLIAAPIYNFDEPIHDPSPVIPHAD